MHVWALGLSCETPAACRPPETFKRQPTKRPVREKRTPEVTQREREKKTRDHLSEGEKKDKKRHPEREKTEPKLGAGEGNKSAKFWPPTLRAPPSRPHPSGAHTKSGPNRSSLSRCFKTGPKAAGPYSVFQDRAKVCLGLTWS